MTERWPFSQILTGAQCAALYPWASDLFAPGAAYEVAQSLCGPICRLVDSRGIGDCGMPEGETGFGTQDRIEAVNKAAKAREYLPGAEPRSYGPEIPERALR